MDELNDADSPCLVSVETDAAGAVRVKLRGELDLGNIDTVDAKVGPALAAKPALLVIDATELSFADSSAIALWLRWAGSVSRLELHNPSQLLLRVVTKMGLGEKLGVTG